MNAVYGNSRYLLGEPQEIHSLCVMRVCEYVYVCVRIHTQTTVCLSVSRGTWHYQEALKG